MMRASARVYGDRFVRGVVPHTGRRAYELADSIVAVPTRSPLEDTDLVVGRCEARLC